MMRRWLIPTAMVCLGLLAPAVRAGLLPVSVSITPEADKYRFTYAIVLPAESKLSAGDFFTIYDFAGYQAGSATYSPPPALPSAASDWSIAISNVGTTPDRLIPDDNSALPNLTWTYSGPTIDTGKTGLGNFWAVSIYGDTTAAAFTAQTHRTSDGKLDSNITDTTVPVPVAPSPGVPEPATLALAGIGLPFMVFARGIRRRIAVSA